MKKTQSKPVTIDELEKLLNSESEEDIEILPNGEIRAAKKKRGKKAKVLTLKENLGGEYARP